jgi:hypothetical protein
MRESGLVHDAAAPAPRPVVAGQGRTVVADPHPNLDDDVDLDTSVELDGSEAIRRR